MGRRLIVAGWCFGTAVVVYFAIVLVFLILLLNEGSGIGGNGLHGPVETFADRVEPWGTITGITVSVVAGLIVARYKTRRWTSRARDTAA